MLKGVDSLGCEVEVVSSLNRADKLSSKLGADEHSRVNVAEALLQVPDSLRNDTASVRSDGTLVCPVVGRMDSGKSGVYGCRRSSYKPVNYLVPQVNLTAEFHSTARKSILASEELGVPESFVLVAHTNTVRIFAVEAEA